jgi:hypothetical protein
MAAWLTCEEVVHLVTEGDWAASEDNVGDSEDDLTLESDPLEGVQRGDQGCDLSLHNDLPDEDQFMDFTVSECSAESGDDDSATEPTTPVPDHAIPTPFNPPPFQSPIGIWQMLNLRRTHAADVQRSGGIVYSTSFSTSVS